MTATSLALVTLLLSADSAKGIPFEWGKQVEVEFIVDGSGSMAGVVTGAPKITWTKNGLKAILEGVPETISGADIGLRVFGAKSPKAKHDCFDTHLEVPVHGVDRQGILRTLGSVHPTGYTPLAASLEAAAKDFHQSGDRILVIITDGIESCGGDPCATSERLVKEGAFQKPYVLGFAVDEEEKKRLSCIGNYIDARSGDELQKLLEEIIRKAVIAARVQVNANNNGKSVPPSALKVILRQGDHQQEFEAGKAVRVPPGDYEVEVSQTADTLCGPVVLPVKVSEGSVTRVVGEFGKGTVKFDSPGTRVGTNLLAETRLEIWPAGKLGQGKPMLAGKANQTAKLCTGRYDFRFSHPSHGSATLPGFEVKPQVTNLVEVRLPGHL